MPRNRKPISLRVIDGDFRCDRHNAFEPETGAPASHTPPRHLPPAVKRCWRELISRAPAGTVRNSDEALLELAAMHLADYREIAAAARAAPMTDNTPNGERVNVLRIEARKLAVSLHRFLSELGYTPASRSRIVAAPEESDPFMQMRRHLDAEGL